MARRRHPCATPVDNARPHHARWALGPLFGVRIAREWQKPLPVIGVDMRTRVERTHGCSLRNPRVAGRHNPPRRLLRRSTTIASKAWSTASSPASRTRCSTRPMPTIAPRAPTRSTARRRSPSACRTCAARRSTLARDDGERAALAPRLDAHIDDAMDGIGRHVAAQRAGVPAQHPRHPPGADPARRRSSSTTTTTRSPVWPRPMPAPPRSWRGSTASRRAPTTKPTS